jgi:predicted Na+-dependent transporter
LVPGTVHFLLGTSVSLDMTGMSIYLTYIVVIPTIIGVALNEISSGRIPSLIGPYIDPFSKLCMVVMIAANSAAVAPQVRPDNYRMWIIIAVCVVFSSIGFTCGMLTGLAGKFKRDKQITLFFASGLRNTSAAMTLGTEFFPGAAALPAVLGIMLQQITASIMIRLFFRTGPKSVDN